MTLRLWKNINSIKYLFVSILFILAPSVYTFTSQAKSAFREIQEFIWYQNNVKNNNQLEIQQHGVRFKVEFPKSLFYINHPESAQEFLKKTGLEACITYNGEKSQLIMSGYYGQELMLIKIHRTKEEAGATINNQDNQSIELAQHAENYFHYAARILSDFHVLPFAHFQSLDEIKINNIHRHSCQIYQMKHISGSKQPFLFMKIRVLFATSCALEILYFNTFIHWESAMKYVKIIQSTKLIEIVDLEYVVDKDINVLSYK